MQCHLLKMLHFQVGRGTLERESIGPKNPVYSLKNLQISLPYVCKKNS